MSEEEIKLSQTEAARLLVCSPNRTIQAPARAAHSAPSFRLLQQPQRYGDRFSTDSPIYHLGQAHMKPYDIADIDQRRSVNLCVLKKPSLAKKDVMERESVDK